MTTEQDESSLWPYREVRVGSLFGDKDFAFALDPQVTILTGENGSGKSTILAAVNALSRGRWAAFHALPIGALELVFANGTRFAATNSEDGLVISGAGEPWMLDLNEVELPDTRRRRELLMAQRELELRRVSPARAATLRERIELLASHTIEPPEWVAGVLEQLHPKLISARRLEHRLRAEPGRDPSQAPESVVDVFAQQIGERMRLELARYAAESQRQEKSLPSRIVHAMQEAPLEDVEQIALQVDALRAEVRRLADLLARVGLFDEEEDPDQQFEGYPRDNPSILLAVREVYQVAAARLSRLSNLRSDLDLFATFLNDRFTRKRVELSPEDGITVSLADRGGIKPSQLSSGEQQLLALTYELLFGTTQRSVVLLDEPELSLHVAWLNGLISAFIDIGERRELQYLVATHSPSIVVGFLDRERSLDLFAR